MPSTKQSLQPWDAYPLQLHERQADAVLHADLVAHPALFAQDGDGLNLDAVLGDAGVVAGDGGGRALDAGPGADTAVPADDGEQDAGVVLDLRVLQHDVLLDAGAGARIKESIVLE